MSSEFNKQVDSYNKLSLAKDGSMNPKFYPGYIDLGCVQKNFDAYAF